MACTNTRAGGLLARFHLDEIDFRSHEVEEAGYRLGVPPSTSALKPAEVTAKGCCEQNGIRILFKFLEWDRFPDRYLSQSV